MQVGQAISFGNTGDRITVQLKDRTVEAIAANEINSSKVIVIELEGQYHVWSETPPVRVLEKSEGIQIIPQLEIITEEVLLPFQILFINPIQLGGDRNQITLNNSAATVGGINNLGNQEYLAVWQIGNQITRDNNGSQSIVNVPNLDYSWLGFGILGAIYYPQIPQPDLSISTTGQVLPPDFAVPLYPVFFERSYQNRQGVKTSSQTNTGYSYNQVETYDYLNNKTGNANNPAPSIFDLNVVCNFTTSGAFETQTYNRTTELSYLKTISETLENPIEIWFNNILYTGDRTETYNETYDYQVTRALFTSGTSFRCTLIGGDPFFGFYQWQGVSNTNANWSGETSTINRSYTKIIDEPEWQRPITPNYARSQHHSYNHTLDEITTYIVPSESWSVPVGSFFLFEVPGTETQTITTITTESKNTVTPLLLSGDGNSALFTEINSTKDENKQSERDRDIPKFLYNNSTEFPDTTRHTETTTCIQSYRERISLYNNGILTELMGADSLYFAIQTNTELNLATLTLGNDDNSPILQEAKNYITQYTKLEDKVSNSITYSGVVESDKTIWDNIEFRPVYLFSQDKRYRGVILNINYQDSPNPDFTIEILRSLLTITIEITEVESYPVGLTEPGEILIASQDNMTLMLRDLLLSSENKNYCNLVGNILYFSKSVKSNLENAEQQAEVYFIDNVVTQDTPESGVFTPVTGVDEVLGISYFPV